MAAAQPPVSVVIPVLNAERHLPALLDALMAQEPAPPAEILILDSMSRDRTRELAARCPAVRIIPVAKFSHGGTRNLGIREARHELVALMTQDALPQGTRWLAELVRALEDPRVAAAYSRQVPYPDAHPMERYFLQTHFPEQAAVRDAGASGGELGLREVFFSNVSALLRRSLLLQFPFDETLIMSEDQQVSRDLMAAGHRVVYAPSSVVVHSHNYTLSVCFRRYFDSAYSLTCIFRQHDFGTCASMGGSYVLKEIAHMAGHHPLWIPYYVVYTGAKTAGYLMGHYARFLPRRVVRACSLHRYHWT